MPIFALSSDSMVDRHASTRRAVCTTAVAAVVGLVDCTSEVLTPGGMHAIFLFVVSFFLFFGVSREKDISCGWGFYLEPPFAWSVCVCLFRFMS